jgi:hypothetical protein
MSAGWKTLDTQNNNWTIDLSGKEDLIEGKDVPVLLFT